MDPVESLSEMLGKISNESEKVSFEQYSSDEIKMVLDYLKTSDKKKLRVRPGNFLLSLFGPRLVSPPMAVCPTYSFSNMIDVVELEKILEKELRRRGEEQSDIQRDEER